MNIFFLFFLILFNPLFASVELEVNDTVQINKPFSIKVTISGNESGSLNIDGMQNLQVLGTSNSMQRSIINGKLSASTSYIYQVVARQDGEYEVGPARIIKDGKDVAVSNIKKINVIAGVPVQPSAQGVSETYFAEIVVDKEKVVLGEPITLTLYFFYRNPVNEIAKPTVELSNFLVKPVLQEEKGQEVRGGALYNYFLLKYVLTPIKIGKSKVGPINIVFSVPTRDDFFGSFFSLSSEQREVATDVIEIEVEPLPAGAGNIVGKFTKLEVNVSANEVRVNEPFELHLTLSGDGNQVSAPKLHLPVSFKYYESSKNDNKFSYVVQATQPGEFEIPAQKIKYFDLDTRKITELKSEALKIIVSGTAVPEVSQVPETPQVPEVPKVPEVHVMSQTFDTSRVFVIIIFLIFIIFVFLFRRFIKKLFAKREPSLEKWAQKQFTTISKNNAYAKLYPFFTEFIARKFLVSTGAVHEDFIRDALKGLNWEKHNIEEFVLFFSDCASVGYGKREYAQDLLKRAQIWLDLLKN